MILGRFHLDQEIYFLNEGYVCTVIRNSHSRSNLPPVNVMWTLIISQCDVDSDNSPFHLFVPQ